MGSSIPGWLQRWEPWLLWLIGAACFAAVPVLSGGIGISWDGLNHHFYLGWIAEHPRFDRDFAAASYQAYQYPYLYWPVYRLGAAQASGVTAGVVLALLQSLAIPAVWKIGRACCPGQSWIDFCLRALGLTLAFMGGVTLSMLDSTSNDMFAAIPFLWALALAFHAAEIPPDRRRHVLGVLLLSGFCAGVAVAAKLSNGPLALVLPLAWWMSPGTAKQRVSAAVLAGLATVLGFLLAYGYWGWQLWVHMGSPLYPFHVEAWDKLQLLMGRSS